MTWPFSSCPGVATAAVGGREPRVEGRRQDLRGGEGAPLAQGKITSVSSTGIEHDVVIDGLRQGAPLVNDRGEVLGMASREYNPGGVGTDRIFIAIPIRNACEQVLSCSSGAAPAASPTTRPPTALARYGGSKNGWVVGVVTVRQRHVGRPGMVKPGCGGTSVVCG